MRKTALKGGRGLLLAAALPALAAFLVFSPALRAGFVWDDLIFRNLQLPRLGSAGDVFAPPDSIPMWPDSYYRPLVTLSLMADERIAEPFFSPEVKRDDDSRAGTPHAVTLAAHALVSALVGLLALRLFRSSHSGLAAPIAVGLTFAVHTANAETASSIAGRSDSLAALFLIAAALSLIRGRDAGSRVWLAIGGVLSLLALLSKETALAGAALIPATLAITRDGTGRTRNGENLLASAPFFAALALYLAVRLAAGVGAGAQPGASLGEAAGNGAKALAYYLFSLAAPWPADPFVTSLPGWPLAVAALTALGALVCLAARGAQRGDRTPAFLLLWFLAALAPALFLVIGKNAVTPVAQRHLYLPGVAFALAVGYALAKTPRDTAGRRIAIGLAAVLLSVHATFSFASASIWKDDATLWRSVLASGDVKSPIPYLNLGNALYRAGDADGAEQNLNLALARADRAKPAQFAAIWKGLGVVALSRGSAYLSEGMLEAAAAELDRAAGWLDKAALTGVSDWSIYKGLGETLLLRAFVDRAATGAYYHERIGAAGRALRKGLALSPGNPELTAMMDRYRSLAASAGMRNIDGF